MDKKNQNLIHISDILDKALGKLRPDIQTDITRIWDIWDRAVGQPIAMNAKPESFKDGELMVTVSSSSWIHQLKFLETEMIVGINKAIGKDLVNRIRFKLGKIYS